MPSLQLGRFRRLCLMLRREIQTSRDLRGFRILVLIRNVTLCFLVWARMCLAGLMRPSLPFYLLRLELLDAAAAMASIDGLWLEFGVYEGETINHLARLTRHELVGFDSFEGLPTGWSPGFSKGAFSLGGRVPPVEPNVELKKGWFEQTLPDFLLVSGEKPVSFIHIDSDLYTSARFVLLHLAEQIRSGTVIVFDEFITSIPDDEYRALRDFLRASGRGFTYLGCSASGSVAIAISR
jgi:hypothetical protein